MDFEKAIRPLGRFTPMLEKVPQAVRDAVFDIRISVDKPVLLCCGDRILFLREDGDTAQYFSQNNVTATREDVEEIFLRLCGYSVYSHMEEIRGGFVSADHALRVGIGGTAVIEKGGIKTVRDVTSLSVRIPREKRGCAEEVLRYGVDLSRGLLLAGAPSSGGSPSDPTGRPMVFLSFQSSSVRARRFVFARNVWVGCRSRGFHVRSRRTAVSTTAGDVTGPMPSGKGPAVFWRSVCARISEKLFLRRKALPAAFVCGTTALSPAV